MVRERFRLGSSRRGKAIAQNLSDPTVERLTPAFEEIFVGRVLDERVLETVIRAWR